MQCTIVDHQQHQRFGVWCCVRLRGHHLAELQRVYHISGTDIPREHAFEGVRTEHDALKIDSHVPTRLVWRPYSAVSPMSSCLAMVRR